MKKKSKIKYKKSLITQVILGDNKKSDFSLTRAVIYLII